jgi:hypothetical protein
LRQTPALVIHGFEAGSLSDELQSIVRFAWLDIWRALTKSRRRSRS